MKKYKEIRESRIGKVAFAILGFILLLCALTSEAGVGVSLASIVLLDLTTFDLTGANTGNQTYNFNWGLIRGCALVPKGWTRAVNSSILANLQADTLKPVGTRIYPIWRFAESTVKDVEDTVIVLGYGDTVNGPRGNFSRTFEILGGGHDLQVNLKTLEKFAYGQGFDIILFDENNTIIGTQAATSGYMDGLTCSFSIKMPKVMSKTGENTKYLMEITLPNVEEYFENLCAIICDDNLEQNLKGIINVTLSDVGTQSTTHIFVDAKTNQGKINLYDIYGADLAKVACWRAWDATGAAIVISNVATYATGSGYDLTGTFPTGTTITCALALPATLAAQTPPIGGAPENGFESNILSIAIP